MVKAATASFGTRTALTMSSPLLIDAIPELAQELEALLVKKNEFSLTGEV